MGASAKTASPRTSPESTSGERAPLGCDPEMSEWTLDAKDFSTFDSSIRALMSAEHARRASASHAVRSTRGCARCPALRNALLVSCPCSKAGRLCDRSPCLVLAASAPRRRAGGQLAGRLMREATCQPIQTKRNRAKPRKAKRTVVSGAKRNTAHLRYLTIQATRAERVAGT